MRELRELREFNLFTRAHVRELRERPLGLTQFTHAPPLELDNMLGHLVTVTDRASDQLTATSARTKADTADN